MTDQKDWKENALREQALYQPPLEPGPKLRSWGQELLHFLVICVLLAGAWFLLGLWFKP